MKQRPNLFSIFKSLPFQIICIFLLLFLPTIFLINYNFYQAEHLFHKKTSGLIQENLYHIESKLDNMLQDMIKLSSIIGSDSQIIELLSQDGYYFTKDFNEFGSEEIIRTSKIQNRISALKNNFSNYNMHVWIFGSDGFIYNSLDQVQDEFAFKVDYAPVYSSQKWYQKTVSLQGRGIWIAPFTYNIQNIEAQNIYISQARMIQDSIHQQDLGVIMISFGSENFQKLLGEQTSIIALLDADNSIIFCTQQEKMESALTSLNDLLTPAGDISGALCTINNENYLVNECMLDTSGWRLVSLTSYHDAMSEIHSLRGKMTIINSVVFLIFILICIGLVLYITNPLQKLIKNIEHRQIGGHDIGKVHKSNDLNNLASAFSYLFDRIEELNQQVLHDQQTENDLKYKALRAQINPHFLFNTLNSIKWSAMISGVDHVAKMISSLGMILEASIDRTEDEIPLREELELTRSYLYIQNIRHGNKFQLDIYIDPELEYVHVPKLILQPCVENSIIHGLGDLTHMNLTIEVTSENDHILITLTDDGIGISPERLNILFSGEGHTLSRSHLSGIGLWNIDKRIKLKYGKQYGLSINSVNFQGTRVFLLLPILKGEPKDVYRDYC